MTTPIRFEGTRLEVNVDADPGGGARVGLRDEFAGGELPGRSVGDCDPLGPSPPDGSPWRRVTWGGDPDLSKFDDCLVRLHFALDRAWAFGFRFAPTRAG
ncbi:MAG: hypothetical protein Kow0069_20350 [Promethearchaeota archaeon]